MTTKGLLNEEALDQVVGGNQGYVYFRENKDSYDAFICSRPLSKDEIANLLKGVQPLPGLNDTHFETELVMGVKKGANAEKIMQLWNKQYSSLSYTAV